MPFYRVSSRRRHGRGRTCGALVPRVLGLRHGLQSTRRATAFQQPELWQFREDTDLQFDRSDTKHLVEYTRLNVAGGGGWRGRRGCGGRSAVCEGGCGAGHRASGTGSRAAAGPGTASARGPRRRADGCRSLPGAAGPPVSDSQHQPLRATPGEYPSTRVSTGATCSRTSTRACRSSGCWGTSSCCSATSCTTRPRR